MRRYVTLFLIAAFVCISGASALDVVSTTTVLSDPIKYIGGDRVQVIAIADPTICPHMQGEIVPNRIQMEKDFIGKADLFVAINGSVDKEYVMPYVDKFMGANHRANVTWKTLKNPSMVWNTPEGAHTLAGESAGWLIAADPGNKSYYEERLASYHAMINATEPSDKERALIAGQEAVVMLWQKEAAEKWLGLKVVSIFAPDFYNKGQSTPRAVINDIFENPEKYRNVKYVIENMQSGDMAKGVEEALHDKGIPAQRVIFTNFPGSVAGAETLPDVLKYNRGLVTPNQTTTKAPSPTKSPLPLAVGISALVLAGLGAMYRSKS